MVTILAGPFANTLRLYEKGRQGGSTALASGLKAAEVRLLLTIRGTGIIVSLFWMHPVWIVAVFSLFSLNRRPS